MKRSLFSRFLAVALLLALSHCGKKKADDPAPAPKTGPTKAPTLSTDGVDSLKSNSALLRGTLTDAGGLTSQYGFLVSATEQTPQYSATPNAAVTVLEQTPVGGVSTQPFKFQATSAPLKAATTYYVRAYARNTIGVGYGEVKSFKTLAEPVAAFDPPTLELRPSTNLKASTVTLNAALTKLGNRPILSYGFALSETDPNPRAASINSRNAGTSTAGALPLAFALDVKDLKTNTKYHVRAWVAAQINNDAPTPKTEYVETPVETFTTPPDATASGTWKELGPYTDALFYGYDFLYEGALYSGSSMLYTGLATYTLATQKQLTNASPKFPGSGDKGELQLVGSKVYSLMNGTESTKPNAEVWEYDLVAKKWTRKADFPGTPRVDGKAIVLNGKLYFGTGNEYTKARPGVATTLNDWWEYDPSADKWTPKANLPQAMYDLDGFVTSGKAVLGQGLSFASGANDPTAWWEYNPQTNAWRTLKKFTGDYTSGFGWVFGQDFGGKNYALLPNQARTKYAMWAYNPATDAWTRGAELPVPFAFDKYFFGYEASGKPVLVDRAQKKVFEFTP